MSAPRSESVKSSKKPLATEDHIVQLPKITPAIAELIECLSDEPPDFVEALAYVLRRRREQSLMYPPTIPA